MGKTKVADKSSKKDKKAELSSIKAGRVTKPATTPKSKSKDIAKSVASNVKDKKKSKKAPTPEPESDSSSESESESEESEESSSEEEEVTKKTATKAKAAPKAAAKADSDSDSSDSSEEDSESESESSEEEKPTPKAKANGVKTNGAAKAKAESSDSESDSESESDSDSSESKDEKPAAKVEATSTSDSSDSDSDSSDSESDEAEAPSKKRKAEEVAEPVIKKTKTDEPVAEDGVKNLFVGNLSWNIDEDWLRREFESFGEIVGCRVITDRETGRAKGFGYVEFAKAADAAKAQKDMHEYELDGRPLNVDFSTPRQKPDANARANKFGDKRSAPSNTLFIGNLSFDCTNETIQEVFAEYGNVTRVSLPTDRDSGALKGFGYVDFGSQEEATAALEALHGQDVAGRPLRVDFAADRKSVV